MTWDLPLVLYGAGNNLAASLEMLGSYNLFPVCICDSDVRKHGINVYGVPVCSLEDAKGKYGKFAVFITVINSAFKQEVMDFLFKEGIEDILLNTDGDMVLTKIRLLGLHSADRLSNYKLYVSDREIQEYYYSKDYLYTSPLTVKVVDDGIILPTRYLEDSVYPYWFRSGGVADKNCNFVEGHLSSKSAMKNSKEVIHTLMFSYNVSNTFVSIDETVVYGGCFSNHYGHFFMEGLSRMWWYLKNPDTTYKFAFIGRDSESNIKYKELLYMLGLKKENIFVVNQPTQFRQIIIPEQSHYLYGPYTNESLMVYNKIRDSVKPAKIKKLYLTKSKLPVKGTLNEEYFEEYFKSKGFEVIFPDDYTIYEQIAFLAGAEELVCSYGTLHQSILFCQDNIKVTAFNNFACITPTSAWVNQARKVKCTVINLCFDFLYKNKLTLTPILLLPTAHWVNYLRDQGDGDYPYDFDSDLQKYALEVIMRTVKDIKSSPITVRPNFDKYSLADFVIDIHKELIQENLDESTIQLLYDYFPRNN